MVLEGALHGLGGVHREVVGRRLAVGIGGDAVEAHGAGRQPPPEHGGVVAHATGLAGHGVVPLLHERDEVRLGDLTVVQRPSVHQREDPLGLVLGEEDLELGRHGDDLVQREHALVVLVAVDGLKHAAQQST